MAPGTGQVAVDLWAASLDPASTLASRLAWCLAPDEEARARRFVAPHDRDRFAAGRAFLRLLLAKYLGVAARDVGFRYDPYGKPVLADPRCGLRFNLAHSGTLAVCAVTRGSGDIGVDVEHVKPIENAEALARAVLSPLELVRLGALPEPVRLRSFYEVWTRKEAFLKALGCGLNRPLHSLEVSFGPGEPPRLLQEPCRPVRARALHTPRVRARGRLCRRGGGGGSSGTRAALDLAVGVTPRAHERNHLREADGSESCALQP